MKKKRNHVEEAVTMVGGSLQAAALMKTTESTVRDWMRKGWIRLARPAVLLSRETGIAIEKLVGLE